MLRLAFRNLFQSRARLLISVGGVGLALLLILTLDAIFSGVEQQVTAYIDHSGADVFVSQSGVRNMHMAASSLPVTTTDEVRAIPGVESVTPILYLTNMVVVGDNRRLAYVIGLPEDAASGKPWRNVQGRDVPRQGEAIIESYLSEVLELGVGDQVKILGQEFTIAGLSAGATNIVNSLAFISLGDFMRMRGTSEAVSFLLVKAAPGQAPEALAARIEANVPLVSAMTREAFAQQERKVVKDMSTDVIAIMNLVGFLIGLAVMALTVYTATLSRRAEYGVLKAVGARNGDLYRVVLAQALYSVGLGLATGVALTVALSLVVPSFISNLALQVSAASLAKVAGASLVLAALSAVLPIRQMAALDPAAVFRRKVR